LLKLSGNPEVLSFLFWFEGVELHKKYMSELTLSARKYFVPYWHVFFLLLWLSSNLSRQSERIRQAM